MTHDVENKSGVAQQPTPISESANLVTFVSELLRTNGHPRPEAWLAYLQTGVDTLEDAKYQRFAINRAWRVIFGRLNEVKQVDTMDVRYCLVDTAGTVDDWKRLFIDGVLPCILEHQAPLQE